MQHAARAEILANGGSLSHHHGGNISTHSQLNLLYSRFSVSIERFLAAKQIEQFCKDVLRILTWQYNALNGSRMMHVKIDIRERFSV